MRDFSTFNGSIWESTWEAFSYINYNIIKNRVSHKMEQVIRLEGILAGILVPEDQVHPAMQVARHVGAFQRSPHDENELLGSLSLHPRRQHHIVHFDFVLLLAQID
jgi:hypothetical protein